MQNRKIFAEYICSRECLIKTLDIKIQITQFRTIVEYDTFLSAQCFHSGCWKVYITVFFQSTIIYKNDNCPILLKGSTDLPIYLSIFLYICIYICVCELALRRCQSDVYRLKDL
jgi:hypothetical protein